MAVNDGSFFGWPFVNHAMELRGTQTTTGPGRASMVLPRFKFTYLVEFQINEEALTPGFSQTDLRNHIQNGRLYASLKRIDLPKTNLKTETLRSYNKFVKIHTTPEFGAFRMQFHDDNTSMAMALWKEYLAFYRNAGDVGRGVVISQNRRLNQNNQFRSQNDLTGTEVRRDMDIHPSIGMTLRPYYKRHFFENITIYDLGSEPDSVNVFRYVNPVIVQTDLDNLDYFDRTGQREVRFTLEPENMYMAVGQNNSVLSPIILQILGISRPVPTLPVRGHVTMVAPNKGLATSPTSLTADPGVLDTNVPPMDTAIRGNPLSPLGIPQAPNPPVAAVPAEQSPFFSPRMEVTQQNIDNLTRTMNETTSNGSPVFDEGQKAVFRDIIQQQQNHLDNLRALDAERAQRAISEATKRAEAATRKQLIQ